MLLASVAVPPKVRLALMKMLVCQGHADMSSEVNNIGVAEHGSVGIMCHYMGTLGPTG